MGCDCDKKPAGAPDDSVRNAAALWIAAGKNAGFVEGIEYAVKYLASAAPAIVGYAGKLELPSAKRARVGAALSELGRTLAGCCATYSSEAAKMNKLAVAMADRLESARSAQRPRIARRMRAALAALRG